MITIAATATTVVIATATTANALLPLPFLSLFLAFTPVSNHHVERRGVNALMATRGNDHTSKVQKLRVEYCMSYMWNPLTLPPLLISAMQGEAMHSHVLITRLGWEFHSRCNLEAA